MGLVATWLSGIGLSSAVPTFHAAGIVTPAALAELDVAHFEALGISDPDDRRKLFYLVQRIKMAVNKKKQEDSVEEQVDAVISGTMNLNSSSSSPKEESNYFDGAKETKEAEEAIDSELAEGKRRSRRIASKQTTHSIVPVSRSKENRRTKESTNNRPTKANSKTEELSRRDDEDLDGSDWKEQKEESTDDEANSRLLKLRSKKRLVEKRHSKAEATTKNDVHSSPNPRSPKKTVVTRSPPKKAVAKAIPVRASSDIPSSRKGSAPPPPPPKLQDKAAPLNDMEYESVEVQAESVSFNEVDSETFEPKVTRKKAAFTRSPPKKAVAKAIPVRASSDIPSSRKGSAPPPPKLQDKAAPLNDMESETVELQAKSASFNDAESEIVEPKVTRKKAAVTRSPLRKAGVKAVPVRASSDTPASRKGPASPPPELQIKFDSFNDVENETFELQAKSASFNDAESETVEPKVTRKKKAAVTQSPPKKAVAKADPMRASPDIPSSRKGSAPPPPKLQVKSDSFNDVESETVELQVKSASFNDAESETFEPKVTTPKSKMSIPRSHVSKLQNPSKSARTGKSLSAIPADKVAPQSPLIALSQSRMEEEVEHQSNRAPPKQNQSEESLDCLLQTASESDDRQSDAESESDSVSVNSRKSTGSRKSSRRSLVPPRRSVSGREDHDSKSSGRRSSITVPRGKPVRSSSPAAFVHGGTEADSWRTKVDDLREDNEAEHELFCGQSEQALYDYDMRIRVIVKKRPGSKTEANLSGGIDVIHPLDYGDYGRILVYQPKTRVDLTKEVETVPFAYDNVFGENSTNVQIYDRSVRNMVAPFFEGQWATVFAYGQTGSGKTYTMMGSNMTGVNAGTAREDESNLGLYYLAALDIFEMIKRPEYAHLTIGASLFEIYGGKLFDLVHERKLIKCLEDSRGKVCYPGLTEHPVSGPNELMELIEGGARNRSTGTTSRNADSSRSHAVLQLNLRKTVGRRTNIEHGRMTFIDLAGSERGADTSSASRATRLEGAEINTSLLALKEVIRALATGGSMKHIPFRGSKLTQVLKDSFVGKNSRCCMVACISPDIQNCDQTLNTLRYSDRVKERNPESGSLAPGYEQPTKIGVISLSRQSSAVEEHDEAYSSASEAGSEEEDISRGVDKETDADNDSMHKAYMSDDGDTVVLDDLLATSTYDTIQHTSSIGSDLPSLPVDASSKRKAGETLVASHRSVMSSMLAMVKNEMALVNGVDADRDGLDDYLAELEKIQQTQMEYITKLRNSLHNYVSAIEGTDQIEDLSEASDDDSFEDLRE